MQTEHELNPRPAQPAARAPRPLPPLVELPESSSYRLKKRLLGPPLHTDQLVHERLGKPTALAVFASDNLSSVAYGTEEIMRHLVPYIGIAAFSLVMPITISLLVVLGFLILSYRQTIKAYPSAGGAYIVTRDNFGLLPAQVAGVALLTDYVLTVSVSVAAGTAALTSAFPALSPYAVPISVFFIAFIAFGNLRGVRESGKMFAVPTYFFIGTMVLLLAVGFFKMAFGHLPVESLHHAGLVKVGTKGNGLLMGAGLFVFLRAFASGGAAVTGVEAISNGVPAFRVPEWKNARSTLVVMGSTLGFMFFGLSLLDARLHVAPFEKGTPTVISQIGKLVFGGGPVGHVLYFALQAGTMLILVLAANTSFADFPRLASFHAGDNFMPRQLTKRGHRLVFSNGIIFLAAASTFLVIITAAKVDRLIPLYAIGVFTSFTLSQAGMAKHHITQKEPGWRGGLFINGTGAVLSFVVDVIIAITKFKPPGAIMGAWVIILLVPVMVLLLVRLNHQYESEAEELEHDAPKAAEAPILRRHVVIVFVEKLDLSAARAIQYARTLVPDELRAVHFALDPVRSEDLQAAWTRLGFSRLSLQIIDVPDRRLTRAALEVVAEALGDGDTEVTVLLPRLEYNRFWHKLLHDRTADDIAEALSQLPHANVTFVPYHLQAKAKNQVRVRRMPHLSRRGGNGNGASVRPDHLADVPVPVGAVPLSQVEFRQRARVAGKVRSLRVQPWSGVASLEVELVDGTGGRLAVVFMGRRQVAGIDVGAHLVVEGMVGEHGGRLAMLNPDYEIVPDEHERPPTSH
ncbi:MAG: amino acid permease [Actinobacteria bacterium]|nr:amino acid permease [Actinomycetota bacterium]